MKNTKNVVEELGIKFKRRHPIDGECSVCHRRGSHDNPCLDEVCRECFYKAYHKSQKIRDSMNCSLKRAFDLMRTRTVFSKEELYHKLLSTKGVCMGFGVEPHYIGLENLTLDHIVPLSKAPDGFIYTIDEIQFLCRRCNSRKHNKTKDL